jgi:serine/threonine-protein kinase
MVCAICAVLAVLSRFLQGVLQPEKGRLLENPAMNTMWIAVVLGAAGIALLQHYRLLSPVTILSIGLGFEVIVAFAISYGETMVPPRSELPIFGISAVTLWITVVGLLIPNKPWIRLVTALISATTWPLAYVLNLHLSGFEPLPLSRFLFWIYMPYMMAVVTYVISRRIYRMEIDVQQVRELGSYNLVSFIGTGGMGEVWRARHRLLARDAAIKLIRNDLMITQPGYRSDVTRTRFKREAQAIASLQCPHTVYLFDFGIAQNGSFYYVMELLDGISLQMLVDKFGPQPASRVIHFLRQVCESLEEAHQKGLIHRDIKPSNIFACNLGLEYDFVKILDFGLVKNISPHETGNLTMTGIVAGTPGYISPEIAMGEGAIDGRVDIYALGCVAYFLLTGAPVFEDKTPTAVVLAHVQKLPSPPSARSEMQVPASVDEIILRCLAKKPEDRPHSARELGDLLAKLPVSEWGREDAADWWQTYLPASSTYRKEL